MHLIFIKILLYILFIINELLIECLTINKMSFIDKLDSIYSPIKVGDIAIKLETKKHKKLYFVIR